MIGKVCVVTGAASPEGIGRATAHLLADHGAQVALIDDDEAIDDAAGQISIDHPNSSAIGIRCNIASRSECLRAATKVSRSFGRVDALINCSTSIPVGNREKVSEEDIIRSFTPLMTAQGAGSVVNVGPGLTGRGATVDPRQTTNDVVVLTKALAREFGPAGIRVNAVCPSVIDMRLFTDAVPRGAIGYATAAIPLGRVGRPDEVAAACLFLASDLASFITGAKLTVDGGRHLSYPRHEGSRSLQPAV